MNWYLRRQPRSTLIPAPRFRFGSRAMMAKFRSTRRSRLRAPSPTLFVPGFLVSSSTLMNWNLRRLPRSTLIPAPRFRFSSRAVMAKFRSTRRSRLRVPSPTLFVPGFLVSSSTLMNWYLRPQPPSTLITAPPFSPLPLAPNNLPLPRRLIQHGRPSRFLDQFHQIILLPFARQILILFRKHDKPNAHLIRGRFPPLHDLGRLVRISRVPCRVVRARCRERIQSTAVLPASRHPEATAAIRCPSL